MFHHFYRLFRAKRPALVVSSKVPAACYEEKLAQKGLRDHVSADALLESQQSVRVFFNDRYLSDQAALRASLEKPAAVSVAGDRNGEFQDGLPFPSESLVYFSHVKPGDGKSLSPEERLTAGKKIIASRSWTFAVGGYPQSNQRRLLTKPVQIGLFSQAGSQFEMPYLHYRLFGLDVFHREVMKHGLFAHLYQGLPTQFEDANLLLGGNDLSEHFGRIRVGYPFLARDLSGGFYTSLFRQNAIIFLKQAYLRHLYEDTALLLSAVNASAKAVGKPAYLKATAVGMGFFAQIDCKYDIKHYLYPLYLTAYRDLLKTGQFDFIAGVEFPIFSSSLEKQYDHIFSEEAYGGVSVMSSKRDILEFSPTEHERYYVCVVNPSDVNALPGNEWGGFSVESMLGNNTLLRLDQVFLVNQKVLDPSHHQGVAIDPYALSTCLKDTSARSSSMTNGKR